MTHAVPRADRALRIRERVLRGSAQALPDAELLALVLGAGTVSARSRTEATRLLDAVDGLVGVVREGERGGVDAQLGARCAARLAAALELGRRAVLALAAEERVVLGSFDAVHSWARPRLAMLEHEEVWLLCVDGRNGLRSEQRIAQGGAHGCALTPRDVLRPAVREGASAIVLVHNHPSGDPEPSPEDFTMTRAVAEACEVVGVPLLDHVVVARRGAASLLERGALER